MSERVPRQQTRSTRRCGHDGRGDESADDRVGRARRDRRRNYPRRPRVVATRGNRDDGRGGQPLVSFGEDVSSGLLTALAFVVPVLGGAVLVLLVVVAVTGWRRLRGAAMSAELAGLTRGTLRTAPTVCRACVWSQSRRVGKEAFFPEPVPVPRRP